MNATEMNHQWETDREDCHKKTLHLYNERLHSIKKMFKNGFNCISFAQYWIHPKTKSEYILSFIVDGKQRLFKPLMMYYPLLRDKGINLLLTSSMKNEIYVLTPHLFDRYAERMGGKFVSYQRLELIEKFITRNWNLSLLLTPKERNGKKEHEMKLPDGAAMCQLNDETNIHILKTFITNDMFYEEQSKRIDALPLSDADMIENHAALAHLLSMQ